MDAYELRKQLGSVVKLLSEILVEVKDLRKDYQEGQACVSSAKNTLVIDSLYNKKYEG